MFSENLDRRAIPARMRQEIRNHEENFPEWTVNIYDTGHAPFECIVESSKENWERNLVSMTDRQQTPLSIAPIFWICSRPSWLMIFSTIFCTSWRPSGTRIMTANRSLRSDSTTERTLKFNAYHLLTMSLSLIDQRFRFFVDQWQMLLNQGMYDSFHQSW